ncbi:MAG: histidinol-phosphatase [Eubacteriales bacterium]|nr:histidinol-phosphatase [Eubacteriales bacterium]
MLYDFHSHILPSVDDGSDSVEQSLKMLDILRDSGVDTVVATPHFYYSKIALDNFLTARDEAYDKLKEAMEGKEYPRILKGAEVLLTTDIPNMKDLESLCIENTSYILIELPYSYWSDWVYRALNDISLRGLKPIIAHIDRYTDASDRCIQRIFYLNCIIQLNVDSLTKLKTRRRALKYIKRGEIHILGSDTHDDLHRPPKFIEAMEILKKKFGTDIETMFEGNSLFVLNDEGY